MTTTTSIRRTCRLVRRRASASDRSDDVFARRVGSRMAIAYVGMREGPRCARNSGLAAACAFTLIGTCGSLRLPRASSAADRAADSGLAACAFADANSSTACDEPRSFATIANRCPRCRPRRWSWGRAATLERPRSVADHVGVLRRARLGARRPKRPSRTSAGGWTGERSLPPRWDVVLPPKPRRRCGRAGSRGDRNTRSVGGLL
jgi:hypothetical protein